MSLSYFGFTEALLTGKKGAVKIKKAGDKKKKVRRWALRHASKDILINMIFALEKQVMTDVLTGLKTRRYFEDECARLLKASVRSKEHVAILFFDIDHFKRVNDTLGHDIGDEVLCAVAKTLQTHVRPLDTVARLGGEEIVVLLPNADEAHACLSAERLRKAVSEISFSAHPDLKVTVSIGIAATFDILGDETSCEALLKAADEAMYAAKHSGRNRVVCYGRLKNEKK